MGPLPTPAHLKAPAALRTQLCAGAHRLQRPPAHGSEETHLSEWGAWIVFFAGLTPFPYKVTTIASGVNGLDS
jgi:membrane protein YqaA with SNARE-associated domain